MTSNSSGSGARAVLREYRDPWSGSIRRHKPLEQVAGRPPDSYDALYSTLLRAGRNASQALLSAVKCNNQGGRQ